MQAVDHKTLQCSGIQFNLHKPMAMNYQHAFYFNHFRAAAGAFMSPFDQSKTGLDTAEVSERKPNPSIKSDSGDVMMDVGNVVMDAGEVVVDVPDSDSQPNGSGVQETACRRDEGAMAVYPEGNSAQLRLIQRSLGMVVFLLSNRFVYACKRCMYNNYTMNKGWNSIASAMLEADRERE